MIATRSFVFIHLHKTGGQFINRLILAHFPDAIRLGYHLPYNETPAELMNLPAIGFVRNPWDWYVSWYAFNAKDPTRNPLFRAVSNDNRLGFKESIHNLLNLGDAEHSAMLNRIANDLPDVRDGKLGSGLTRTVISSLRGETSGYFTWLWRYMFRNSQGPDRITIGRMETLRQDFAAFLAGIPGSKNADFLQALFCSDPVNTSRRTRYQTYYDTDLGQEVGLKDAEIIETYGYSF